MKILQENIVDVFDSLTGIFDDVNIIFDKDGLTINQTDRSMVVFVNVKLKPSAWEEYGLDRRECLSVSLNSLVEVLKRFKREDRLVIDIEKSRINISNDTKTFKLPLLTNTGGENPDISKLDFKVDLEVKKDICIEAIRDSSLFAETMTLEFDDKKLLFKSQDGNGEYMKKLFIGNSDLKTITTGKAVSRYSIDYMSKIFKKPFGETINVKFGKDFPIKISFKSDNKEVSYVLAPRVGEGDEDEKGNDEEQTDRNSKEAHTTHTNNS